MNWQTDPWNQTKRKTILYVFIQQAYVPQSGLGPVQEAAYLSVTSGSGPGGMCLPSGR